MCVCVCVCVCVFVYVYICVYTNVLACTDTDIHTQIHTPPTLEDTTVLKSLSAIATDYGSVCVCVHVVGADLAAKTARTFVCTMRPNWTTLSDIFTCTRHARTHARTHTHTHTQAHKTHNMYVVCMYVYTHIHTYMYIDVCIYVYTHTYRERERDRERER